VKYLLFNFSSKVSKFPLQTIMNNKLIKPSHACLFYNSFSFIQAKLTGGQPQQQQPSVEANQTDTTAPPTDSR